MLSAMFMGKYTEPENLPTKGEDIDNYADNYDDEDDM